MPVHGHRAERLADLIRTEVAEIISGELKDPRIGFATVTSVDLSPDLHLARVSVSVLGSAEERQRLLAGAGFGYGLRAARTRRAAGTETDS